MPNLHFLVLIWCKFNAHFCWTSFFLNFEQLHKTYFCSFLLSETNSIFGNLTIFKGLNLIEKVVTGDHDPDA